MQFDDKTLFPYQGDKPYIFLSYSHRDAEPAAEIIRGMNLDGFRIWYDEGLVPGREWDENIARAIMNCSYFVALMSANYLASANCRDELNYARDKKLPLLLLYLEDVELPAGMELRLGRMLAIHTHKYVRREQVFTKIRAADGISVCRDFPEGKKAEPEIGAETVTNTSPVQKKSIPKPVLFGVPALIVAALAMFLIFGRGGAPENSPTVTEAPTVSADPSAAVTPDISEAPTIAETAAPAETSGPVGAPADKPQTTPADASGAEQVSEEERAYREAETLQENGRIASAALAFNKLGDYRDAQQRSRELWNASIKQSTVSIGTELSLGLKENGTLHIAGGEGKSKADVSDWGNLIAVAVGNEHTLGLLADGTVVSKGWNSHGERNVGDWRNIVSIVAGNEISLGLRADGTVVACGDNSTGQCDVDDWTDIVAVAVGDQHTVGLRSDGTVVSTGYNSNGQRNVEDWTDIVAIAAGAYHTLGVKADGTVVAVGYNAQKQCDVSDWTDIIAVSAGKRHSVGLKADGTVVAVGYSSDTLQLDEIKKWTNVLEIESAEMAVIALRDDGTAYATGDNTDNKCYVIGWNDLRLPARVLG